MAQPFDADALALRGEPVPIAENVGTTIYGYGRFTVSWNGGLAYASGSSVNFSQLIWFDRTGKNLGTIGQPGRYGTLRLSPDGSRVAVEKQDTGAAGGSDLWLVDSAPAGRNERFTFQPGRESAPLWSPDGTQIAYSGEGFMKLFQKPTNLTGREEELLKFPGTSALGDWSRDGKNILYTASGGGPTAEDIGSISLADKKLTLFVNSAAREGAGRLSPDGRWLAYFANPTGTTQIYVRPFPANEAGGQQMVSLQGGNYPLWRRDGKELYFRNSGKMMAVDVTPGATLKFGQPRELFSMPANLVDTGTTAYSWDVTADGSRFLINAQGDATSQEAPLTLVLNWTSGLK